MLSLGRMDTSITRIHRPPAHNKKNGTRRLGKKTGRQTFPFAGKDC